MKYILYFTLQAALFLLSVWPESLMDKGFRHFQPCHFTPAQEDADTTRISPQNQP